MSLPLEENKLPLVLVVGGSDSSAGAGVESDIKTFSYFGIYACPIYTALTAQNSQGIEEILPIPLKFQKKVWETLKKDLSFSAIKISMLYHEDSLSLLLKILEEEKFSYVLFDPVLKAHEGTPLQKRSLIPLIKKKLLPKVKIFTPNLPEAEIFLGKKLSSKEEMLSSLKEFFSWGISYPILKGGHQKGKEVEDILFNGEEFIFAKHKKIKGEFHATGCLFASSLLSYLLKGFPIEEAFLKASFFTYENIKNAFPIGKGISYLFPYGSGA